MTLIEALNEVRKTFPNATVGEDNDGQIVIYTDKVIDKNEVLADFVEGTD